MLRGGHHKHVALIAYLAIITLPSACSAFWMRFIWKNGLTDPDGIADASFSITQYTQTGEQPQSLSDTLKFPQGAMQCQLMQELAPHEHGPQDPVPGIIGVLDSPRAGLQVQYLFFFEDEVCGMTPSMFLRLEPSKDNKGTTGNYYSINLLNDAVPVFKSWKQADDDDPIDRKIIEAWSRPVRADRSTPPSRAYINIAERDMGSNLRWKHVINDEKALPTTLLRDDKQIETLLGYRLIQALGTWLQNEQKYRKEQEELDIDFGSEGFNFVPMNRFTLSAQRVAAYMVQEEYERLGLPVPRIKTQPDDGLNRGIRRQPDLQTTVNSNSQPTIIEENEADSDTLANIPIDVGGQQPDNQYQLRSSSLAPQQEENRGGRNHPVDRISPPLGMNARYPIFNPPRIPHRQYSGNTLPQFQQPQHNYNYNPSAPPQNVNYNPLSRQYGPNNNQQGSKPQDRSDSTLRRNPG
ncbi:hypothetical protein TWF192_007739 [Orbilia oligospora]|uniref:Uncharacterized protein n=1 Tax=Orbilia oligospora TaxID=2813651 RepID=A0A6G1M3L2_ORBOL|nr:hypothetical protein TWF679_007271 [Orbilia oligospora]KAF3244447.1 hypothetical protein TWF192_007739 [Orbilia oligospora]